jgi:hypothetical protein
MAAGAWRPQDLPSEGLGYLNAKCRNLADILFAFGIPGIVRRCMRTQTPAPSPNNLPSRTATAGDTGLRSRKIS